MGKVEVYQKRKLSPFKLFDKLQKEYLIAKIRSKIYPKASDRNFWKKYMAHKKEKIEDIVRKNTIPSIFTDSKLLHDYESQIMGKMGCPNFDYKDQADYDRLYKLDLHNYYHKGTEVKVNLSDTDIVFGVIQGFDFEKSMVCVKINSTGKEDVYHSEVVTRIL